MRRIAFVGLALALSACSSNQRANVSRNTSSPSISIVSSDASASSASSPSSTHKPRAATHSPIPILVYHHVRKDAGWRKHTWSWILSVSAENFEKQMQWLQDHGYTTIDLDTFVAIMKGDVAGPAKPVVITFDDNNESQYAAALPALLKHKMVAVFYLVMRRIDRPTFLTTAQIKEMVADGMDIESHTLTHAELPMIGTNNLDRELIDSKKELEALTGRPVRHLAYPLTMQNAVVRLHARDAGYITGAIMDPRRATANDDLMKLPRITMNNGTKVENVLP